MLTRSNPYIEQVEQVLPRLLALFDRDATSESCGMGDRYRWAWGLIDFGNGTLQGAAHGLAALWKNGFWPYATKREIFLRRIKDIFSAAAKLTRRDGSLEEAFPNEGSFCVTALVAFDLLCALDLLKEDVSEGTKDLWKETIAPMIDFLRKSNETHAVISNHLATASAALSRWHSLTGCLRSEQKASNLLATILQCQSTEGWFKEYDGADPGYQTLCTYYLADVHALRPDLGLLEPLRRSVRFLVNFAHPDGSFGGNYGSRSTRFFYPAGFEQLAPAIPEANTLCSFMRKSISKRRVVSLVSMDTPNLVPMFNAYCRAASLHGTMEEDNQPERHLPAFTLRCSARFPEAGLILDGGPRHYTIISTNKGGVVSHFRNGKLFFSNSGVVVLSPDGKKGSTQGYRPENSVSLEKEKITVEAPVTAMPKRLPAPWEFLILRILCCTFFRISLFREWAKKMLVKHLITKRDEWPLKNRRTFILGEDLLVRDELLGPGGYKRLEECGDFVAIHMASKGYWQIQDEGESS